MEHREEHREYMRTWRIAHGEEIRKQRHDHYQRHRKELLQYAKLYGTTHKEQRRQYRLDHMKHILAYNKHYDAIHPEQRRAIIATHKARRASASGSGFTGSDFITKLKAQKYLCFYCGKKMIIKGNRFHPDYVTIEHIIPLSKEGKHDPSNIVLACRDCNTRKNAQLPSSFAGMLNP